MARARRRLLGDLGLQGSQLGAQLVGLVSELKESVQSHRHEVLLRSATRCVLGRGIPIEKEVHERVEGLDVVEGATRVVLLHEVHHDHLEVGSVLNQTCTPPRQEGQSITYLCRKS